MASGAELPMAAALMYRHWTVKASASGSKGLWVKRGLEQNPSFSFGTEEYSCGYIRTAAHELRVPQTFGRQYHFIQ